MSITLEVHETEDAGVFPYWPMWLRCDRCGHEHLPYYADQQVYNLYPGREYKHGAHVVRSRARTAGWDAPGFGGFDVCPPCQEIIAAACESVPVNQEEKP